MLKNKKKLLVAASIAGLMASTTVAMAGSAFPGHDSMNKSHCDMNSCKGSHSCKGAKNSCGGSNACKGHNGCKGAPAAATSAS